MKKSIIFSSSLILILMAMLSGCEIVGGIFKAGVWSGIIVVVVIIALILYFISRAGKKE